MFDEVNKCTRMFVKHTPVPVLCCRDVTDLLNRVTNLQLSNKKLAEENSKLRSERETADDLMLQTNQEVEHLKKTIRRYTVTSRDASCETVLLVVKQSTNHRDNISSFAVVCQPSRDSDHVCVCCSSNQMTLDGVCLCFGHHVTMDHVCVF